MAVELSTVGERERLEREAFERLYSKARSLCDEKLFGRLFSYTDFRILADKILQDSRSAEEFEAKIARVLDALPKYE